MARLAAQARAAAVGAGLGCLVAGQVLAHRGRIGLAVAPREVGDDALEGMARLTMRGLPFWAPLSGLVDELDVVGARAVQQHLLHPGRASDSNGVSMSKP
jgi:hypothetical protein